MVTSFVSGVGWLLTVYPKRFRGCANDVQEHRPIVAERPEAVTTPCLKRRSRQVLSSRRLPVSTCGRAHASNGRSEWRSEARTRSLEGMARKRP
jgi:hypothetical protein